MLKTIVIFQQFDILIVSLKVIRLSILHNWQEKNKDGKNDTQIK